MRRMSLFNRHLQLPKREATPKGSKNTSRLLSVVFRMYAGAGDVVVLGVFPCR